MSTQDHWQQVYNTKSSTSVSWYQAEPEASLDALTKFSASPSSSFIDIGGGASMLVDSLLAKGWSDLSVLDIAESTLAVPEARLGDTAIQVCWVTADITTWKPTRRYDIWHDRAVFHFLTEPHQRASYRQALEAGVVSGGHVIIATFALDGPEKCSNLPVQRHDAVSAQRELGPAFKLLETWPQAHSTPGGNVQKFNWCLFKRV